MRRLKRVRRNEDFQSKLKDRIDIIKGKSLYSPVEILEDCHRKAAESTCEYNYLRIDKGLLMKLKHNPLKKRKTKKETNSEMDDFTVTNQMMKREEKSETRME
ncbi:hypothetical protein PUN28_011893 [Cardiocondyla obscurior]|uniref:Uncharacterized protein n=1 Tax=Cardiocondyla obscurior TaxID=286306 RepID=A0AAW2FJC2_9HYME